MLHVHPQCFQRLRESHSDLTGTNTKSLIEELCHLSCKVSPMGHPDYSTTIWIKPKVLLVCVCPSAQSPQKCLTATRASPLQPRTKPSPPGAPGTHSALLGFTLAHFNPAGSSCHSDLPEQFSPHLPCLMMCFASPTFPQLLWHSKELQSSSSARSLFPCFQGLLQLCSTALLMCNYSNKGKKGKNFPGNC